MRDSEVDSYKQLCKVGDILYKVYKGKITKVTIKRVAQYPHYVYTDTNNNFYYNRNISTSGNKSANCFTTLEEAKQEALRQKKIVKKRELLKKYEAMLNEKLNLKDHFVL